MAKIKVCHLTRTGYESRWNALREIAKQNQWDLEITIQPPDLTSPEALLTQINSLGANALIVDEEVSDLILERLPNLPVNTKIKGGFDFLLRQKNLWEPYSLLSDTFIDTVTKHIGSIERGAGILVGHSSNANQVAACMVKMGFYRIHIVGQDNKISEKFVKNLMAKYFDIEFKYIPIQVITTLPGIYNIIVNTIPLKLENKVLEELYFFNFLHKNGVVIDLVDIPMETPILKEAKHWSSKHLAGHTFLPAIDSQIIYLLFGKQIDQKAYFESLKKELGTVAFDIEPFMAQFKKRSES